MDFRFHIPTVVEARPGISKSCGSYLKKVGAQRVFVVTDKGIMQAGLLDAIEASMQEAQLEYTIFDKTEPNPSAESIMSGLEDARLTEQTMCLLSAVAAALIRLKASP